MSRPVRVGIFVLGALSILAVGIFLIGRAQGLFSSGYILNATFVNVSGLQNGAQVRVGGINEGTVKVIKLPTRPDEKVTVVMQLAKLTRNVIKKDSVGSIRSEGLVGAQYVEISFGSNDAPSVQDGDTIASEPPIDFSDILKKTNTILDSTSSMTGNLNTVAENLSQITSKINDGRGSLGQLVNDKQMYKQLNETTTQAAAGATAFKDNMQALQHNFLLRGYFKKRGYADSDDMTAHAIDALPPGSYAKKFSYDATKIFDKDDSAKLKSEKTLEDAGRYLESNKFGAAVVVAYTGARGDSAQDMTLTEARSMVVRDYLVKHFKIQDDARLRTLGLGKNGTDVTQGDGGIDVVIYPVGTGLPEAKVSDK